MIGLMKELGGTITKCCEQFINQFGLDSKLTQYYSFNHKMFLQKLIQNHVYSQNQLYLTYNHKITVSSGERGKLSC